MKKPLVVRSALVAALAATSIVVAGCSSDNTPTGGGGAPPPPALVATWNATSLTAGGQDLTAMGVTLSFTFNNDNTYSFTAANDPGNIFCDTGANCTDGGIYSATGSGITFDPGTVDEVSLGYTISGTTLTATGTLDGNTVTFVFQKM